MFINKKVILPATLGSLLAPIVGNADTIMFDNSDVEHIGKVNNKDLVRGSHVKQEHNSNFKGYFNGGLDIVNVPYNRPVNNATVMLHGENDREVSYGSGMFVSPRVIVTAAHLFLKHGETTTRKDHMVNGLRAVLGHNSPMNGWSLTSGEALPLKESDIHVWNERDFSVRTQQGEYRVQFYNDLAVVTLPKPMQLISPDKKAEFNELATDEEMDKIKDGDSIRYIGYPTNAKKGDQNALTKDIERGRLYEVQGKVAGYTDPETGKPYYKSKKTGETNPYYPLARFLSSGLQGMSGSAVLNANNKVVGVFQAVRDSRYGGGDKQGQVIPDSPHQDAIWKASGGMFFTKEQRDWIRDIIEQNKVTGFYQDSKTGKKYYFGEDQHMVRSTTKVIDGHNYSFDEAGVATDLGEVKRGNVYIRYVLDTGEEFMRPIKYITNEVVGESIDYNYKHDPILNKHEFIKYKEYNVKSVDNANGKVVEGDRYVTVTLTKNYNRINIAKLRKINDNINTYLGSLDFNRFLDFKSKSLPKNIKDELLVKHQQLERDNNKLEEYLNQLRKQISDNITQNMIDNKVSEYNKKMNDFTSFVHNAEILYDKIVEYKDVYDKKKGLIDTIPYYSLDDKDYIKSGVDYDNFIKLHSTLSDLTIKDDYVQKDVERLIDTINNLDNNQIDKYKEAFEKLQYKEIVKKQEDVSFDIKYEGVKNLDSSYDVITKGENGKVEIVKITIRQGSSGKVINTTEERNVLKNMISEVRKYKEQPKVDKTKEERPKEQFKDEKPKVEQSKEETLKEQSKEERPKEQSKEEIPKEQSKEERPKEQSKEEIPKEQSKEERPKEQSKVETTKEQAKDEKPKVEQPKVENPKEQSKVEKPEEQTKVEQPKNEKSKVENPKAEEPKKEQPKVEEPKKEQSKEEQPKEEQPKEEQPKEEQPKVEELKKEQPKVETEEPKVEKEQSKVDKEQSKVDKEQFKNEKPEVNKEQPKVEKEQSKVEKQQSNVNKEEPKVDKEQSKVEKEQLKVDKEQSKINKEQSKVDKEQSKVDKEQSKVDKEQSKVDKEQSKVDKEQSKVDKEQSKVDKEQSKTNNNEILPRRKLLPETGDTNGLGNLGLAGLGVVFGFWLTRRNEKVNRRYKRF